MSEIPEVFIDRWLETNVTATPARRSRADIISKLAQKCLADAQAQGISQEELEDVVCDVEEAIADEMECASLRASLAAGKATTQ